MFATLILVAGAKAVAYGAFAFVAGGASGYAFRGKVRKGLGAVESGAAKELQTVASDAAKKV